MMYYGCFKLVQESPAGKRLTEVRVSGNVDAGREIKLVRCVGKSFWDKASKKDSLPVKPGLTQTFPQKSA